MTETPPPAGWQPPNPAPGTSQRTAARAYPVQMGAESLGAREPQRPGGYIAPETTFEAPARGGTRLLGPGGGVQYEWRGQAAAQWINERLLQGFARLANVARDYWEREEWTPGNHPEMTGAERDSANFIVAPTGQGRVVFTMSTRVPYAAFEEWGTAYRPGHYPLRKTLDRVYRRAAYVIARANVAGPPAR